MRTNAADVPIIAIGAGKKGRISGIILKTAVVRWHFHENPHDDRFLRLRYQLPLG